ncbi:MAG: PocR ligand-binding domain-containing protein [Armatimonadota bacterium]
MGKITLSEIVTLPAFEEAGMLFFQAMGMTLSFKDEAGAVLFYPQQERCGVCHLVNTTAEGRERCRLSDERAEKKALRTGRPLAYTCHAGLTDVVVPVIVGGEPIGCFYSGQSLVSPPTREGFQAMRKRLAGLAIDESLLWEAYQMVKVVDESKLSLAMGLMSVICTHLVEGTIALRQERELTQEQRKLRRAAEEKVRLERDLREMEMRLLQAQLNPHFLFNALNLIQGNAMLEQAPETTRLLEELTLLLRNALTSIGSLVPLADEVASARAYVEIFRARFSRQVSLQTELPETLNGVLVPPLILQPVVENALVHALPHRNCPLQLHLTAVLKDPWYELRLRDNGPGIERPLLTSVRRGLRRANPEGKLTGLIGVNKRLKYYYPELPDLRLESSANGLTVVISLPA